MDRVMRSRVPWSPLVLLREHLAQLGNGSAHGGGERQTQYLVRLMGRQARDPRELLRRYANDSML